MDFLNKNKGLIGLALAILLTALAAFTKVDVSGLLTSVTTIDKQVGGLTDAVAPAAPAPTATPAPPVE